MSATGAMGAMKRFARAVLVVSAGCLITPSGSMAGQPLRGRIVDARGAGIAGAIVTANDRVTAHTTSVYSDRSGRYAFADLSAASYELRARRFGYRDRTKLDVKPGT